MPKCTKFTIIQTGSGYFVCQSPLVSIGIIILVCSDEGNHVTLLQSWRGSQRKRLTWWDELLLFTSHFLMTVSYLNGWWLERKCLFNLNFDLLNKDKSNLLPGYQPVWITTVGIKTVWWWTEQGLGCLRVLQKQHVSTNPLKKKIKLTQKKYQQGSEVVSNIVCTEQWFLCNAVQKSLLQLLLKSKDGEKNGL